MHTNDVGAAIEVALDLDGRPRTIRVTDLFEEVDEEHAKREAAMAGGAGAPTWPGAARRRRSAAGHHGDRRGVQRRRTRRAVRQARRAGRRHRRPDDEPVDRRAARHRRARQRRPGRDPAEQQEHHPGRRAGRRARPRKNVRVVPTRTMPEALAALVVYDPEADGDENAAEMIEAADSRRHGRDHAGGPRHDDRRSARSPTATGSV